VFTILQQNSCKRLLFYSKTCYSSRTTTIAGREKQQPLHNALGLGQLPAHSGSFIEREQLNTRADEMMKETLIRKEIGANEKRRNGKPRV
jgi:hypothetical protein